MSKPRKIPAPAGISRAAAAFLNAAPVTPAPHPADSDPQAWRDYVVAGDEALAKVLAARPATLSSASATRVASRPVYVGAPPITPRDDRIVLSFHGGALLFGGGALVAYDACRVSELTGLPTWSVDYGMPPDRPFPEGLDDAEAVYDALSAMVGAELVIVHGLSAGGNIATALLLNLKRQGKPLPGALILRTPEIDLTESGDSFETNLGLDPVLPARLSPLNAMYAAGQDLADPRLSPLFADFSGPWPRTLLQSGTRDLFLSNTVRLHRKLRDAGHDAQLHVWEAMPHGGFGGSTPEDAEIGQEVRRFIASPATPRAARHEEPPQSIP